MSNLEGFKEAIEQGRVSLMVQPVVDLINNRQPVSYECFARVNDNKRLYGEAKNFVRSIEQNLMVRYLDQEVMKLVFDRLQQLYDMGQPTTLYCNISIESILYHKIYGGIFDTLAKVPHLAKHIVFELDFNGLSKQSGSILEFIMSASELGTRFSVDRFRFAAVDISWLGSFQFIKMQATALLENLATDPDRALKVSNFVQTLSSAGIAFIVTHVEREDQLVRLSHLNLRYAQGHLFGPVRPVTMLIQQQSAKSVAG